MPVLEKELGSFGRSIMTYRGSFLAQGTGQPTVIRDGNCGITAVAFISTGLFEVTITPAASGVPVSGQFLGAPLPKIWITEKAGLQPASAAPTILGDAYVVNGSWTTGTYKFRILVTTGANGNTPTNPDTGTRVWFELTGSIISPGTDKA